MSDLLEMRAPGCFGSAAAYAERSAICRACGFGEECAPRAKALLYALREVMGVADLIDEERQRSRRKAVAGELPPEGERAPEAPKQPAQIEGVSKKGSACVKVIEKYQAQHGVNVKELLRAGTNPFASEGPKYLRETFDALLHGGFSKSGLKRRLMDRLDWRDGTAGAHVSIVMSALPYLDLIEERGETFALKE